MIKVNLIVITGTGVEFPVILVPRVSMLKDQNFKVKALRGMCDLEQDCTLDHLNLTVTKPRRTGYQLILQFLN